ncbi:MAG: ArnT family glycosyltransferase [Endomicrobiales bacterium]
MKDKKVKKEKQQAGREPGIWGSPALVYALVAGWASVVAYYYLQVYPVRLPYLSAFFAAAPGNGMSPGDLFFPLRYLREFFVALALFLSAFGWGSLVNRVLKLGGGHTLEQVMIRTGLGLVVLIYALLAMGSAGALYTFTVGALAAAGAAFAAAEVFRRTAAVPVRMSPVRLLPKLLVAVILAAVFFALIGALSPETFYDSLKYHIAVPQYWIQHHAISTIPDFAYSFYPVNIHILYIPALMFGNEISAKLVHFLFGLLTALLVYAWSRKSFSAGTGILAAFIFLLTPFVMMVMWKTAIELGLAFFETLAVLCFLNFLSREDGHQTRWLALSAVFCGTAIGGKYLSVYCFLGLSALLVAHLAGSRAPLGEALRKVALFGAITFLLPAPYLVRNYLLTGMPAYPYGASLGKDITASSKGSDVEFTDPAKPDRSVVNFLALPWNLSMGKKTQEPFSGAFLLLLLPLPFLFRGADRRMRYLSWYVLVYYAVWFWVRTYFRYAIPFVPAAGVMFAYFVMEPKVHRYARNFMLLALILLGVSHLIFAVSSELVTMNPWGVVKGGESRKDYLSTHRQSYPNPYYQVVEWANRTIAPGSTILFLGECRGYYSERKFVTQTVGDFNPLITRMKGVRSADGLRAVLQKEGITHLLLSMPEARRLAGYDMLHFEPEELKIFGQFWKKYVREAYRDIGDVSAIEKGIYSLRKEQPAWWQGYSSDPRNYVYLYEILSEDEARKPRAAPALPFLDQSLYAAERWEKLKATAAALNP